MSLLVSADPHAPYFTSHHLFLASLVLLSPTQVKELVLFHLKYDFRVHNNVY